MWFINTKIVATLGPASNNPGTIKELIEAGANVFRLNFSHASERYEKETALIETIRELSKSLRRPIGILADLQGPKFRTWRLKDGKPIELKQKECLKFCLCKSKRRGRRDEGNEGNEGNKGNKGNKGDEGDEGNEETITTPDELLVTALQPGNRVLLSDGEMEVIVKERISEYELSVEVVRGGLLGEKKGVNVPDLHFRFSGLTSKDERDCVFALDHKVDFIALSFVQAHEDVKYLRSFIARVRQSRDGAFNGVPIPLIISKIERPQAVTHIDEILRESDGIMVARGDMGVELGFSKVPAIQKQLIRKANAAGKIVITATQMLESMMSKSMPTRAEVSDVHNAVRDGTDALMLSGEVAAGKFPVQCVQTMANIAKEAECVQNKEVAQREGITEEERMWAEKRHLLPRTPANNTNEEDGNETSCPFRLFKYGPHDHHYQAIANGAVHCAVVAHAHAIVTISFTGSMALRVSKLRPSMPVLAFSPHQQIVQRMTLTYGVTPLLLGTLTTSDDTLAKIKETIIASNFDFVKRGETVVICSGKTHLSGLTRTVMISEIGTHIESVHALTTPRQTSNSFVAEHD